MKLVAAWFVSFVFFLSSCGITMVVAPKYLDVPLDYAIKYPLLPDSARVLFISQADFGKLGLNEKKLKTIRAAAYSALKYASEELSQAQQIKVIGLPDSATMPFSPDSVKSLAATYHSDYILALTDFHAEVALNSMDDANAYYDSAVDVNFTLYKGDGTYYKRLSGTAEMQRATKPNFGLLASLVFQPSVGKSKDSIISASKVAVFYALLDYLPHTTTHSRPLYGGADLQPIVTEILSGHFDVAYNLSQPFLNDANTALASRAAYNLAVVYEARGDIDGAINMAQFSLDKGKNPFASDILKDLKDEQ